MRTVAVLIHTLLLFCGFFLALPVSSFAGSSRFVRVVKQWKMKGKPGLAQWNQKGTRLLVHEKIGKLGQLWILERNTGKKVRSFRSKSAFWPIFGPVGSIFFGSHKDLPPLPVSKKRKTSKRKTSKRATTARKRKVAKKRSHKKRKQHKKRVGKKTKPAKKQKPKARPQWGLWIGQGTQKTYLFPGCFPRYSQEARRLVFSYRGVMYLWNPMQSQRKGLLLLSRGAEPRWAPNGRAIAFLQKPFRKGRGGGVWVVDMRFRAARLTKSGGQVTWGAKGKSLLFAGRHPSSKKLGIAEIILKGKKPKPRWIVADGQAPHTSPNPRKPVIPLVAYHNQKGVWVQHRKTGRKLLLASGAKNPRWSAKGELVVHIGKSIQILQLKSMAILELSKK